MSDDLTNAEEKIYLCGGPVTAAEASILAEAANGKCVLEVGTGTGISTKAMARTAERVVTVDVDPWVKEVIAPKLPDNVTFMTTVPEDIKFDMVFIDGEHSQDAVRHDLYTARRLGIPLVYMHDLHLRCVGSVVYALDLKVHEFGTVFGLGMLDWSPR
jgi:predicted nicotinamide N-methyase